MPRQGQSIQQGKKFHPLLCILRSFGRPHFYINGFCHAQKLSPRGMRAREHATQVKRRRHSLPQSPTTWKKCWAGNDSTCCCVTHNPRNFGSLVDLLACQVTFTINQIKLFREHEEEWSQIQTIYLPKMCLESPCTVAWFSHIIYCLSD